jgi:hypothetical protein
MGGVRETPKQLVSEGVCQLPEHKRERSVGGGSPIVGLVMAVLCVAAAIGLCNAIEWTALCSLFQQFPIDRSDFWMRVFGP